MDSIIERVLAVVMPSVVQMMKASSTLGIPGVIVAGTWNGTDGTASVLRMDTAAVFTDQGDSQVVLPGVPIAMDPTDQNGPIGDEQVMLHRTHAGWFATRYTDLDPGSGLGAPAGERWTVHLTPSGTDPVTGKITSTIDMIVKMTNDAKTSGDGLVGYVQTGGAYHSRETAGGHKDTFDDIAQAITRTSAGGHKIIWDDAGRVLSTVSAGGLAHHLSDATGQITHIAGSAQTTLDSIRSEIAHIATSGVGLGDFPHNLSAVNQAINNSHLTTFESSMFTKRLDDLTKFATAMIAAGVPNAAAVIGQLATLLHIPIPAGSASTFIKS